jgi:hypothetical protein
MVLGTFEDRMLARLHDATLTVLEKPLCIAGFLATYSADGSLMAIQQVNVEKKAAPNALAVCDDGSVVIAGSVRQTYERSWDAFVGKFAMPP